MNKVGTSQEMGRGARAKVEKDLANFLNDGFATAGPDGQYLFDSDHPKNPEETGIMYDNLLSGAFSHDNLEAAETEITNNFIGPDGIPIMPDEDPILLYPPALRGAVQRVLSDRAAERPGTANRDINRFQGRYRPVEWRWLAAAFGGSDTAWFIIYPSMKMLKIIWSAKPHYNSWIDYEDEFYVFSGRMLYDFGATNWRFGFGSTGV
jgi:Mu-like prophage major head subunit gpT